MNTLTEYKRNTLEPTTRPVVRVERTITACRPTELAFGRDLASNGKAVLATAAIFLGLFTLAMADDALMSSAEFQPLSEMGSGLPAPEWAGNEVASYQYYRFLDDSMSGTADVFQNPFGNPGFVVNVNSGQSWLDPEDPASTVREDNGGVWEIENGDQLTFSIPLQQGSNGGLSLDFLLNIVAFQGEGLFDSFYSLPDFSVDGYAIDDLIGDSGPLGEPGSNGDWVYLSWQGTVHGVTGGEISFVVSNAGNGTLALVDSFEAYVIPEPGTYVLLLGIAAATAVAIRRKMSR